MPHARGLCTCLAGNVRRITDQNGYLTLFRIAPALWHTIVCEREAPYHRFSLGFALNDREAYALLHMAHAWCASRPPLISFRLLQAYELSRCVWQARGSVQRRHGHRGVGGFSRKGVRRHMFAGHNQGMFWAGPTTTLCRHHRRHPRRSTSSQKASAQEDAVLRTTTTLHQLRASTLTPSLGSVTAAWHRSKSRVPGVPRYRRCSTARAANAHCACCRCTHATETNTTCPSAWRRSCTTARPYMSSTGIPAW